MRYGKPPASSPYIDIEKVRGRLLLRCESCGGKLEVKRKIHWGLFIKAALVAAVAILAYVGLCASLRAAFVFLGWPR